MSARDMEVLGDGMGIGDFVPWVGMIGKLIGGGGSSAAPQQAQLQQQMQQQMMQLQMQQQQKAAEASAKTMQMALFGVLGLIAVGGIIFAVRK